MSLDQVETLTADLRRALAVDPLSVGPLLCELVHAVEALRHTRPEKARVLKVWRRNRALQQMLQEAIGEQPLRRTGARA